MRKFKPQFSVVLILTLCLTLLLTSSVALAQKDISTKYQDFEMIANDNQLKTLNDLYGKNISYGELIEKVYPEAIDRIPEDVVKNMYKLKLKWPGKNS